MRRRSALKQGSTWCRFRAKGAGHRRCRIAARGELRPTQLAVSGAPAEVPLKLYLFEQEISHQAAKA